MNRPSLHRCRLDQSAVLRNDNVQTVNQASPWRGVVPITRRPRGQQCGIVLGGFGTGGFEIWDDGGFHLWQIFNNGTFIYGRHRTAVQPIMPATGLFFAVRARTASGSGLWKLHMPRHQFDQWVEEPYHVPMLRFPDAIAFSGRQPFARLDFSLAECPLDVSMEAFTPMVVHDLDASAWPAAVFTLQLHNRDRADVSVAAIGSLQNVGADGDAATARHEIVATDQGLALFYPPPAGRDDRGAGSMALSAHGPAEELSYCRKWAATDINPSLFWAQLERDNRLGNDESKIARRMALAAVAAEMGWQGPDGRASDLTQAQRIELADRLREMDESHAIEHWLPHYKGGATRSPHADRDLLLETIAQRFYVQQPLYGSVARTVHLRPGQRQQIRFMLTWHYPNHDAVGAAACADRCRIPVDSSLLPEPIGHRYAAYGDDALAISRRFAPQVDELEASSSAFVAALYDSSLPPWLCDAINAQFTSLATNSIYAGNGDFALWPGSGCCGFAELGTGFFSSIPLLLFYPDAAKRQLELLAKHQTEDGRIPHSLARRFDDPTPIYYDDDYLKLPLQVYRDWVWTGDDAYLCRMWPRLVKNLQIARTLDLDGDGIPDMRGHNQDYDQWMMFGLGIYAASHWPIALRMMACMGRAAGEADHCDAWEAEARCAAERIDHALWIDQWYGLYRDSRLNVRSDALLANNLCGEWYARMVGMTPSLPAERIRRNLTSVFERNRMPGTGLRNGWFPDTERRLIGIRDWHWNVCWLGVEYATASHMIYEGLVEEGLTICREAHERHDRQGLRYNHFECGEHYTRALTVWSVLLAIQDFGWNAVTQSLRFRPRHSPRDHRSPLVLPTGWGVVTQTMDAGTCQWRLQLHQGSLALRELELAWMPSSLHLDDRSLTFDTRGSSIRLGQAVTLQAGSQLEARATPQA